MTPNEALAIVDKMVAICEEMPLTSSGQAVVIRNATRSCVTLAAEVRRLRGIVATLCDDVEACLGLEYPHRDQYPSQMRKFENEMETIHEYRRSIEGGGS